MYLWHLMTSLGAGTQVKSELRSRSHTAMSEYMAEAYCALLCCLETRAIRDWHQPARNAAYDAPGALGFC